jgi:protein TonB
MLPTLIESRRPLASGGALGGGALSFLVHSALIAGAIYATFHATEVVQVARMIVDLPLLQQKAPEPPKARILGAVPAFNTLAIPTTILPEIPPPARAPFDPTSFSGLGVANPVAWGTVATAPAAPRPDSVYSTEMLEELPVRVSGPAARYPELLRAARITGRVMVEFVIDTAGHVEPASLRVTASTNRMFDRPAIEALAAWLFQPARIGGRAVRALVRMPVDFVM